MREITSHKTLGLDSPIRIEVCDDADKDGIHYKYETYLWKSTEWQKSQRFEFQKGLAYPNPADPLVPVVGVNGLTDQSVLAIVLDRLQLYQKSKESCREVSLAITKIEEAMDWLDRATRNRIIKGLEGQFKK